MKLLNGYRIRLVLIGFVAGIVIGAGSASADFIFGEATNLGPPVNSGGIDFSPCISADGFSLYLIHDKPATEPVLWDISVSVRASIDEPWGVPVNLGPPINSASKDYCPSISADGLELYFASQRPGGFGSKHDLWVTMRTTTNDEWGEPVNLGPPVNTETGETAPCISSDGLTLFFRSGNRPGGFGSGDIWMTTRTGAHDPWGEPQNLGPMVNSSVPEYYMSVSADGLVLIFDSTREGGLGNRDLYYTRRRTTDDDWGPPVNLGSAVNSPDWDGCPNISGDGSTLYFCSGRPGMYYNRDIWQAPIIPIVDFTGDGIVDSTDM